ncbi:hypothetical protein [Halopiger thermotolerans]
MGERFNHWLSCPDCSGDEDVSLLAHGTDIVVECYGCGRIAEFTLGEDTPFQNVSAVLEGGSGESATD